MSRATLRILAVLTVLASVTLVSGQELWDPHFLSADDRGSLDLHAQRLLEGTIKAPSDQAPQDAAIMGELYFTADRVVALQDFARGAEIFGGFLARQKDADLAPTVAALAHHLHAGCLWQSGQLEAARSEWSHLGALSDWWIIGPFDNERGSGFSVAYPPEKEFDRTASYPGKRQPVTWRRWAEFCPTAGVLRLGELMRPRKEALAYMVTHLRAGSDQEVVLHLSSSGAFAVWLNGVQVAKRDVDRPRTFDQDLIPVRLGKGWNRLLIKTAQTQGDWEIRVRVTGVDGRELGDLVRCQASPPEKEALAKAVSQEGLTPPVDPVEELAKAPPTAATQRLLTFLLEKRSSYDVTKHPDREALDKAVALAPKSATNHYLLADTYKKKITHSAEREENRWRQELEKALALDGNLLRADLDLARYYLNRFDNRTRADELLEPLLALKTPPTAALQLQAQIMAERYGDAAATDLNKHIRSRLKLEPNLDLRVKEAQRMAQMGHLEEAGDVIRAGLRYDAAAPDLRRELVDISIANADVKTARTQLTFLEKAYPQDAEYPQQLSDLEASREDWGAALDAIDRALIIAPDDEKIHHARGELLLLLDRRDAALDEFSKSLALEPNQPRLREYVQLLKSEGSFLEKYRIATDDLIKKALAEKTFENEPYRILLENQAVHLHPDGTTTRFHQFLARITNDQGIRELDTYSIPYAYGEQWVKVLVAKVHHPDGRVEEAQIRNRDPQVREGEYPVWSSSWVDLPPLQRGDVVEIEYRQEDLKQSFFGDYFGDMVEFSGTEPRDRTVYTIIAPAEKQLFIHQRHLDAKPVEKVVNGLRTWQWDVHGIPKVEREPQMPPLDELVAMVEVSTFKDWNAFATWYYHLVRKQFESSDAIRAKVADLTKDAKTPQEKIRAIYDFVVTDVRYIAWEFGIHGFKPYNASTIFTRRFGDCKDKATLLCTMLGVAGIKAYPVLIEGTRNRSLEDFTLPLVQHFNHCIAYVPDTGNGKSMFLDGTAEHHPVNQLPMMDRGARVVVVEDSGAKVTEIPWNRPADEKIQENSQVSIGGGGGADVETEAHLTGDYGVAIRSGLEIAGERASLLERILGRRYPGVKVTKVETSPLDDLSKPVWIRYSLKVPDYIETSGEEIKLPPLHDLFGTTESLKGTASRAERIHDLLLGNPSESELRVEIELPAGYRADNLPAPVDVEAPQAHYTFKADQKGNRIVLERSLKTLSPRVPVNEYPKYKDFADRVQRSLDERIVLKKSEGGP